MKFALQTHNQRGVCLWAYKSFCSKKNIHWCLLQGFIVQLMIILVFTVITVDLLLVGVLW